MMKRNIPSFLIGLLCGAVLVGGSVAYATGIMATRNTSKVYVNGVYTPMESYNINGNNYFKLRDLGYEMDFEVQWDQATRSIQIDTTKGYSYGHATDAPKTSLTDYEDLRQETAERINDLRHQYGLHDLTIDDDLMLAAQVRAVEAATSGVYEHYRPDGSDNNTVLVYTGTMWMGENLGMKDMRIYDDASGLPEIQVTSWRNSEAHFANMLRSDYHSLGIGIAQDEFDMHYVVLLMTGGNYTVTAVDDPIIK